MVSEKKHSTNHAITHLYKSLLRQRDCDNAVCGTFFGFHQSIWLFSHQILLKKLEHYGVQGETDDLLNSYLTNRFQFAKNNGELVSSGLFPVTIEVPQGSISGHCYSYSVYQRSSEFLQLCIILFADDSVMICNAKNIQNLKTTSEKEFLRVQIW